MISGLELKCLRESLHLSQQHLANIAGVKDRTVRYWESGHTKVPADVVISLKEINNDINIQIGEDLESLYKQGFFDDEPDDILDEGVPVLSIETYTNDKDYHASTDYKNWPELPYSCLHRAYAMRLKNAIEADMGKAEIIISGS